MPKFHCEFNPIERVWSYLKFLLRSGCPDLPQGGPFKDKVEAALRLVPRSAITNYCTSAMRYIWFYSLEGCESYPVAEELKKRFSRHRGVPPRDRYLCTDVEAAIAQITEQLVQQQRDLLGPHLAP